MKGIGNQVNAPIDMRWQFSPTTYVVGKKRGYHPDPSFFVKKKTNYRKELRTFRPETEPQCGKN